jgi:hypothetical protein
MIIDNNKLYRLLTPIGMGTNCTTGPGLIVGSCLKEAIKRSGLQIETIESFIEEIKEDIEWKHNKQ